MKEVKEQNFEILHLHSYKVKLHNGEGLIINLPYGKTSQISAILFGGITEFKEIIKEYVNPEGIRIDTEDVRVAGLKVVAKALEVLDRNFAENMMGQVNDILNIALTEYDEKGVKIKEGNCFMLSPEDVREIIDVLLYDLREVIKNVFGVGAAKKRQPSPRKEKTTAETEQTEAGHQE